MPLRDQSNIVSVVESPHKRGQKTADEVLEHQYLVKALAQGLVNNCEQIHLAWRARMEPSYQTGSNNHPLRAQNKGAKRYICKFDAENPGGVLKLF